MGKRFSYEYVKEYFENHGCKLISKEYIDSRTKLEYKCENCGLKNRSGKNHYQWVTDREQKKEDYKLKQRCHKLLRYPFILIKKNKTNSNKEIYGYSSN